jgi:hypothetical protein
MISSRHFYSLLMAGLLWLGWNATPARAQNLKTEIWTASEILLKISPELDPGLNWHDIWPDTLRLYTELQEGPGFPSMSQLLWRMGPIWDLHPNFSLATHFTNAVAQNLRQKTFIEEHRFELEPTIRGRLLPWLAWANRQRLEYRIRPDHQRWRYRNRIGLSIDLPDKNWIPFLSSEFFFDLSGEDFNQNRSIVGLGWQINPSIRMNFSYIFRSLKQQGVWETSHVAFISLIYTSRENAIFQLQSD